MYVGYFVVVAFFSFTQHNTSVSPSYRTEKKTDTNLNSSLEFYLVTECNFSFSLSGIKSNILSVFLGGKSNRG